MGMKCLNCGREVPQKTKGPARKTCSDRCRKAWSRMRQDTPAYFHMVRARRWARADGKRPVMPSGAPASSTNPDTWSTFDEVQSGAGDGFGFMLGGGIGCYDIDNVFDDDVPKLWFAEVLREIREPVIFVERSVSGRGLHVFVELPEQRGSRRAVGDGSVEKYSFGRFIRCGDPLGLKEEMRCARPTAEEERPAPSQE